MKQSTNIKLASNNVVSSKKRNWRKLLWLMIKFALKLGYFIYRLLKFLDDLDSTS